MTVSSDYQFVIFRRFSNVNMRDTIIYGILKAIHVKEVILTIIRTCDMGTKLIVLNAKCVKVILTSIHTRDIETKLMVHSVKRVQ